MLAFFEKWFIVFTNKLIKKRLERRVNINIRLVS